MAFGATIMARLGLDTSGFSKPLRDAGNESEQAHRRMEQGAKRNKGAHDDLWKSENRIEHQISNTAKSILDGADATEIFTSSIEGLAKSLNLSLATMAGLGVATIAIDEVKKIGDEYRKLQAEIDKVLRPQGPVENRTLAAIEEHAKSAIAALRTLEAEQSKLEGGAGASASIGRYLKDFVIGQGFGGSAVANQREQQIKQLRASEDRDLSAATAKKSLALDLDGDRTSPDYIKAARKAQMEARERIAETGTPGSAKENQTLSMELRRELEQTLMGIAESVATKRRDRAQLTLSDLAENSAQSARSTGMGLRGWTGVAQTGNLQAEYQGRQAREALRLQEEARQKVLKFGDLNGAQESLNRADEIKRGIGGLKDSEKDLKGEFMGALDASKVLQEIKENTAKPLTNGGR